MTSRVTVLYEDCLTPHSTGTQFGPHLLLVECILDDLRAEGHDPPDRFTVARHHVLANPKNGHANVKREFLQNGALLTRDGSSLVAVYDLDKVDRLIDDVAIKSRRCKRAMRECLRGGPEAPTAGWVYFLNANTETLLDAARRILGRPSAGKPRPAERDSILQALIAQGPEARAALRERVPSFDYIVRKVAELARPLLTGG